MRTAKGNFRSAMFYARKHNSSAVCLVVAPLLGCTATVYADCQQASFARQFVANSFLTRPIVMS